MDKCRHEWEMTNVQYGFVLFERCFHCNILRTCFSLEGYASVGEEYREGKHFFNILEKAQIIRLCEKANIPFSPIAKPDDLFDDLQLNKGESLVEVTLPDGSKTKLPKLPLRMDSHDFGLYNDAPRIGEGGKEVLKSIGLQDQEIAELKKTGIIVSDS